jgi:hypothetical protein
MRDNRDLLEQIALGAAGGFAGTLALQALLGASQKWLPVATPPLRQHPGEFMVERAEQALLGAIAWAAGYLGRLPALGLMRPVWEQDAPEALAPAAEHVVYGVVTVAAYNRLRESVSQAG